MSARPVRTTRRLFCQAALAGAIALALPPLVAATGAAPIGPSAIFTITPPEPPTLWIEQPTPGAILGDRLDVVVSATNVTAITCRLDDGQAVTLVADPASECWRGALSTTVLGAGDHRLMVTAQGNDSSALTVPVALLMPPAVGPAPTTYALTLAVEGPGRWVATPPAARYTAGQTVTIAAQPEPGAVFLGWQVDGASCGWGTTLPLTIERDRSIVVTFATSPTYRDIAETTPNAAAIAQLTARGVIRGYSDGSFGPDDTVLRCQLAALLVRAMGWSGDGAENPFRDRSGVDDELWRAVGILAAHAVARGYGDGTYGTLGPVLGVQVVAFVSRAMVARGLWSAQPDTPALHPEIPASSGHREDLATFNHYAGTITGAGEQPGHFTTWAKVAGRGWFVGILWQALNSQFGG